MSKSPQPIVSMKRNSVNREWVTPEAEGDFEYHLVPINTYWEIGVDVPKGKYEVFIGISSEWPQNVNLYDPTKVTASNLVNLIISAGTDTAGLGWHPKVISQLQTAAGVIVKVSSTQGQGYRMNSGESLRSSQDSFTVRYRRVG